MTWLKESVVQALNEAGRPQKAKELARALEVDTQDYRSFRKFLRQLQAEGEIYRVKGGRYAPPGRINLVVGHLTFIKSGSAFLIPEKAGEEDVFVHAAELGNAYHGDKVVVRVESRRRRGPEGKVVRVLERARTEFVGTVRRGKHFVMVAPDDPKFPKEVVVPLPEAGKARDGEKVMVEVTDWGSSHSAPIGRIDEVLGMPGDPGLDVLMIIKHNGLPTGFPEHVQAAADAIPGEVPAEEIAKRLDLRDIQIVTIDPVTAKDFDDALSLTETSDGNLELGVHIADVSHYVRYGDVLDEEAWARGTSVYLVDRVLPMLPEKLSNHLCSLNPQVDRLAMSVLMKMTPEGKMLDYRIEDTVIRSTRRLTYEQVQSYFEGNKDLRKDLDEIVGLLDRLRGMARMLHEKRADRGALDFDLPTSRVELDEQGLPVDIQKVVRLESHRLVEEFMLLANETVARHLKRQKAPTLFRVHEDPKEEKLEQLNLMLDRFGYALNVDHKGRIPPKELQRLLHDCEDKPEEQIVNTLVLRSLARARYDPYPLGHYGLALKDYTHFTSPIRRYPDLVVHRTLRFLSKKQKSPFQNKASYKEWIEDTAVHSSERERLAEEAERDSIELKKIQFMERHLGEVFPGIVTGVQVFGFFVELADFHVSGLVHTNNLDDDYYEYWEEEFSLVGSNTGRRFTLGDRVTVQVLSVDRKLRQIDFLLEGVEEPAEEPRSKRLKKAKTAFEGKQKSGRRPPRGEKKGRGARRKRSSQRRAAEGRGGSKKRGAAKKRGGGKKQGRKKRR